MSQALPRGIWYEEARKRYRVRVYRKNRVIHRSYHQDLDAARRALQQAKQLRASIRAQEARPVRSVQDQVRALKENLI